MNTLYVKCIKRGLDLALSLPALILLSPLMIVLALVGAVALKGTPFFVQRRHGRNGRVFNIIKFRSMTNASRSGKLLPDERRLTKYGMFLRRTSLDELPELINILIGNMSIVGPRPLIAKQLRPYDKYRARRHEVRPGLTGWAQVHGRNSITREQKFDYDMWYVDHVSFLLDLKIIIMTARSVLTREGVGGGDKSAKLPRH